MTRAGLNPWWTVFSGAVGAALGAGIFILYIWTVFSSVLGEEFNWDRSTVALCMTTFLVTTGFGVLAIGQLVDRWGVRRPTMVFVAVFGVSVMSLAVLPPVPSLFYVVFAVMGFAGAAATAMPYAVSIGGLFDRNRGLALGLAVVGGGIGALLSPHLASLLIATVGWRIGSVVVGVLFGGGALFCLLFLTREPPRKTSRGRSDQQLNDWQLYIKRLDFWLIGAAILGISVAAFGIIGSAIPILTDREFSRAAAAGVLSMAAVGSIVGRVVVGALMDRIFAPYVVCGVLLLAALGVLAVGYASQDVLLIAGITTIGLALGAEADILAYMVSRYVAPEAFGRAVAALWAIWAWTGGVGAYIAGASYDLSGSYLLAVWVFFGILVTSAMIVCLLGPYPFGPAHDGSADA